MGQKVDTYDGKGNLLSSVDTRTPEDFARVEAKAWSDLREKRNILLVETDFYALSDVTMSSNMGTYRQTLRDLPANTSDPTDVTWPTKPS